jgi:hypothetical protein
VSALEPSLTVYDRRVLMAVPEGGDPEKRLRKGGPARTVWEIGEALGTLFVSDVWATLSGLEHLGYIASAKSRERGHMVWWRTQRGDDAL